MLYPDPRGWAARLDGRCYGAALKSKEPLFTGENAGYAARCCERTAREIEQYLESKGHPQAVAGRVIAIEPEHFISISRRPEACRRSPS